MSEIISLGANLRRLRNERGLSQQRLSERSGVAVETISNYERGNRWPRYRYIQLLAHALDVDPSDLVGKRNRIQHVGDSGILEVRNAIANPTLLPGLDSNEDASPAAPQELWRSVERCYGAYFAGEFGVLAADLPGLLAECRASETEFGPGAVAASYAHAYQLAAVLLNHTGMDDAALMGAERAINVAHRGDDEYRLATLYGTYVWVLLRMGRHAEAESLAVRSAERIQPSMSTSDPRQLTAWGGLMLHAAVVAGGAGRGDDADEYLGMCRAGAARFVDGDRHDYWVSFGPTQVEMQTAHVWTALESPDKALKASQRVGRDDLFDISWARHLLNESKALADRRRTDEAIEVAARSYRQSPEWFAHQGFAGSLVGELVERKTRIPGPLQQMVAAVQKTDE